MVQQYVAFLGDLGKLVTHPVLLFFKCANGLFYFLDVVKRLKFRLKDTHSFIDCLGALLVHVNLIIEIVQFVKVYLC